MSRLKDSRISGARSVSSRLGSRVPVKVGDYTPLDSQLVDVVAWNTTRQADSLIANDDTVAGDARGVKSWANLQTDVGLQLYSSISEVEAAWQPILDVDGFGGLPCLDFSAQTYYGLSAEVSDAATSWTIIAALDVQGDDSVLIDVETGRLQILDEVVTGVGPGIYDGAYKAVGANHVTGRQILTWKLDAATGAEIFRGTTSIGTSTYVGKAMGATFKLGRRHNSTTAPSFGGRVAELIICRGAQSNAAIEEAVNGLAKVLNLEGSAGMSGGS